MSTSKHNLVSNEWEMSTIERKYSMPPGGSQSPSIPPHQELQPARGDRGSTSEDLHAWSIYRWVWPKETFVGDLPPSLPEQLPPGALYFLYIFFRYINSAWHLLFQAKFEFGFHRLGSGIERKESSSLWKLSTERIDGSEYPQPPSLWTKVSCSVSCKYNNPIQPDKTYMLFLLTGQL